MADFALTVQFKAKHKTEAKELVKSALAAFPEFNKAVLMDADNLEVKDGEE